MGMRAPLRPALRFWLAQLLLYFRRADAALALLREVARERPDHQQAWSTIGFVLAERGELAAALDAFDRALALDPRDSGTHFNVGYVLQQQGRHEEALAALERAVAADPANDRAWFGAGLSLVRLSRLEEAAARFEEAARLQPFNPYAAYELAAVYHRLGRPEKVRAQYERVKGFDPKVSERIRREFGVAVR